MFSVTTIAPSTMTPKSRAPSEKRLAGILVKCIRMKTAANAKGMVVAAMSALARAPEKQNEHEADQTDPLEHRVHHLINRSLRPGRPGSI